MRCLLAVLLTAALLGVAAAEVPGLRASKPEVRKAIVATIEAQLQAFRERDAEKAFGYAATALQMQKPFEIFMAIVQANYPEIWHNQRAEYGIVRDDGTTATVLVHVYAPDADTSYDYTLVKERGRWRIHGILRHAPDDDMTL